MIELFSFNGCIGRFNYFTRELVTGLIAVLMVFIFIASAAAESGFMMVVCGLFWTILGFIKLASAVKRCHDLNKNGWWCLVPIWNLIALYFIQGIEDNNRFKSQTYSDTPEGVLKTKRISKIVGLCLLGMVVLFVILAIMIPTSKEVETAGSDLAIRDEPESEKPYWEKEVPEENWDFSELPKTDPPKSSKTKRDSRSEHQKRIFDMMRGIRVTAIDLAEAYQSNELSADSKYKENKVRISGTVNNVSKTFGDIIVYLAADEFGINTINCTMRKSELRSVSYLNRGDSVVIAGKVDGEIIGTVIVSDCTVE